MELRLFERFLVPEVPLVIIYQLLDVLCLFLLLLDSLLPIWLVVFEVLAPRPNH